MTSESELEMRLEYHAGRRLSSREVTTLKDKIQTDPDNVLLRLRLLGYFYENSEKELSNDEIGMREDSIVCCINQIPHCALSRLADLDTSVTGPDDAYFRVGKCWMDAVARHPKDARVAWHAAEFFVFRDPRKSVEILLQSVPETTAVQKHLKLLTEAYLRIQRREGQGAIVGLEHIQAVLDSAFVSEKSVVLSVSLAELAVEGGELKAAKEHLEYFFRNENEEKTREIDYQRHRAHLLRGQVAVREGDLQLARKELLTAADVPDTPQMKIAGPSMRLARDLIRIGETDVVLEYIDRWKSRWTAPGSLFLTKWEDEIRRGEEPDFKPNVRY